MSVFKRKGSNKWWYKFEKNGEVFRQSTGLTNKRAAEKMEEAHKTNIELGRVGLIEKRKAPTLKAFVVDFMAAIANQCAEKPRTIEFYRSRAATLAESPLGKKPLDTIDEEAIEKYRQQRSASISRRNLTLSPASVNRELATLRRLLRMAHEHKILNRVPRVKLLRGEKDREFILPHEKEALYFAALPEPLNDVALILLDTGLRLGELTSMEWQQVHLEPASAAKFGYLKVLAGKAKSGKSRNVPLSLRAVEALRRQGPAKEGLVFKRADGKPLEKSLLGQQQKRARDLLKLPADFVLHSLRHSFGTRLGEAGADAFTIMRLMGHSTVTVSQRYVHPSPEAVELAYERFTELNKSRVGTVSDTVPDRDSKQQQ